LNCGVIVFANGQSGVGYVDEEAKEYARSNNIKLIVKTTPEAIEIFNKLQCEKAAAIHVTC